MSKHTPGPWEKQHGMLVGSNGVPVTLAGSGFCNAPDIGTGERKANTRLAESAPELLDALKGFTDYPEDMLNEFRESRSGVFTMTVPVALMAQALDAIAKAEGR